MKYCVHSGPSVLVLFMGQSPNTDWLEFKLSSQRKTRAAAKLGLRGMPNGSTPFLPWRASAKVTHVLHTCCHPSCIPQRWSHHQFSIFIHFITTNIEFFRIKNKSMIIVQIFTLFELSTKKIFKENSSKYWQEKFAKRNIVNRVRCRRAKLLLFCILSAFLETFWPLLLDGYIRYVFHTVIKVEFLAKNSILAKLYFSTYLNFCV